MLQSLARYPEVIELAAVNRAPHALVHYLRELANAFHTYYNAEQFIVRGAETAQRPPRAGTGGAAGDP